MFQKRIGELLLLYIYLGEDDYEEYYGEYEYEYDYDYELGDYLDGPEGRQDAGQQLDGYQDNYSYATGDQEC